MAGRGANPCGADGNGDTALHYACQDVGGGVDDKAWLRILHMLLFAEAKLWTRNGVRGMCGIDCVRVLLIQCVFLATELDDGRPRSEAVATGATCRGCTSIHGN